MIFFVEKGAIVPKELSCPKCGKTLEKTGFHGLWCSNGCYESEYAVWAAILDKYEQEKTES